MSGVPEEHDVWGEVQTLPVSGALSVLRALQSTWSDFVIVGGFRRSMRKHVSRCPRYLMCCSLSVQVKVPQQMHKGSSILQNLLSTK